MSSVRQDYVNRLISRLSDLVAEAIGDALGISSWKPAWDYVEHPSTVLNECARSYIKTGEGREQLDAAAKTVLESWRAAAQHYRKAHEEGTTPPV